MDANEYSPWWHDPRRNDEQMITDCDLRIENRPESGWSFHGARGSSNVDITTTRGLLGRIRNWSMDPNAISSDHSLISFTIVDQATHTTIPRALRFNDIRIDKTELQKATRDILIRYTNQGSSLDHDAIAITESVRQACINVLPKRMRDRPTRPPWWNEHVNTSRQAVNRAKRTMLRTGLPEDRQIFKTRRNAHVANIRKAKKDIWVKFVQDPLPGNNKVWAS